MRLRDQIIAAFLALRLANAAQPEKPQPAFRFTSNGRLIECLMVGLPKSSGVHILPTMHFGDIDPMIVKAIEIESNDALRNESEFTGSRIGQSDLTDDSTKNIQSTTPHNVAWLPRPGLLNDVGLYAVQCVSLYSKDIGQDALHTHSRWTSWSKGAAFEGKKMNSYQSLGNKSYCSQLATLIGRRDFDESSVLQIVKSLEIGSCPGVVVEGVEGKTYQNSDDIFNAPPALIRIQRSVPETLDWLPHCSAQHSSWGRWLPLSQARQLIINGGSIPQDRKKYWVPYLCKSTYWDYAAFSNVARRKFLGNSNCNFVALQKVLFLGDSTTSGIFASMREFVFGEKKKLVARNKIEDHLLERKGLELSSSHLNFPGFDLSFSLRGLLLPEYDGKSREDMQSDRRAQLEKLVKEIRPTAIVMNFGIHELCGAFGSHWFQRNKEHVSCSTRSELRDAYLDYGAALSDFGYANRTLFRSIYGTFPDIPRGNWRWKGFALEMSTNRKVSRKREKEHDPITNPCPAVAGPASYAAWVEDDARKAWSERGVGYVDTWPPVHSSPTADVTLSEDGLHMKASSDEVLAINQLIIGALCALP